MRIVLAPRARETTQRRCLCACDSARLACGRRVLAPAQFVHVFPKLDASKAASGGEVEDSLSPAQLLVFSEMDTFKAMIAAKTPTFSQRKRALDALKASKARIASLEEALTAMKPLSDDEQSWYDAVDAEGLGLKISWLAQTLEKMVDDGQARAAHTRTHNLLGAADRRTHANAHARTQARTQARTRCCTHALTHNACTHPRARARMHARRREFTPSRARSRTRALDTTATHVLTHFRGFLGLVATRLRISCRSER
uniref:Uncharacterized protein n=1 Tax=Chrysotila carterae TaxID=13221 RepID=A0A7S4BKD9_CHRCT